MGSSISDLIEGDLGAAGPPKIQRVDPTASGHVLTLWATLERANPDRNTGLNKKKMQMSPHAENHTIQKITRRIGTMNVRTM